jgi:glycosyltransferase involved in cell wall biosynthesis
MPGHPCHVTLALLAYNEAATIENTVREAAAQMQSTFAEGEWELLIINDGSCDETGALCEALSTQLAGVRVYHHNPNRGYIEATLSALREANGIYICVFDGDGQHTAADVPRFVKKLERGCDIVFGWKKQRFDHPSRLILTRGLRLAARYFLHTRLHDINAGCRGYRKEHVEKLSVIKHRINFIGPELYTRARLHDLEICEMIVRHKPRAGGESSHPLHKISGEIQEVFSYLRALRRELQQAGKHRRFL